MSHQHLVGQACGIEIESQRQVIDGFCALLEDLFGFRATIDT